MRKNAEKVAMEITSGLLEKEGVLLNGQEERLIKLISSQISDMYDYIDLQFAMLKCKKGQR